MSVIARFATVITCLGALYAGNAPADQVNLALGATATANSSYSSMTPVKAIDGNDSTIWNAGDHASAANPNWLRIDLGEVFSVGRIAVFWAQTDGRYANYTNVYNFYTSANGSDWALQKSGTFYDESPNLADRQFTLDFLAPIDIRFAKYEVTGGSHWSNVAEISIYQAAQNPPLDVPEPGSLALFGLGLAGFGLLRRRPG